MTALSLTATVSQTRSRAIAAVLAMTFGFGLVFATGFAGSDVLHAAAHDTRHGFSFPCH